MNSLASQLEFPSFLPKPKAHATFQRASCLQVRRTWRKALKAWTPDLYRDLSSAIARRGKNKGFEFAQRGKQWEITTEWTRRALKESWIRVERSLSAGYWQTLGSYLVPRIPVVQNEETIGITLLSAFRRWAGRLSKTQQGQSHVTEGPRGLTEQRLHHLYLDVATTR